ncbi:MAG: hypothetical protein R3E39_19310 [Anaerolineae bacterium]
MEHAKGQLKMDAGDAVLLDANLLETDPPAGWETGGSHIYRCSNV